MSSQVSLILVN